MTLRVGTWNLENLFRPGAGAGPNSPETYAAKLGQLAAVITAQAPDVLAVQEVGQPEALQDLATLLGRSWKFELADADGRGIRVGFLSARALTHVTQVADFTPGLRPIQVDDTGPDIIRMGRPALRVRIRTAGRNLDLLTCHLKSKLLTFPGGRFSTTDEDERARHGVYALHRRAAEAAAVRSDATQLLAADMALLVVLGDLNDEAAAATTQILQGPPGSEIGTGGFDQPDAGDDQRLWNLAPRIPADQRYSRISRGRRELIDHILVSHDLARGVADGDVTTGPDPTPSIGDHPAVRSDAIGSDHRMVIAKLDL